MEKPQAIIEIDDSKVRLLVGGVSNNRPYVVYQTERSTTGLVSRTDILDESKLIQILSSISHIKSEEARLLLNISDANLILPPCGFQVFICDKTTNAVSQTGIIESLDIRNVLMLVQKERVPNESVIVDIIPESFMLEMGKIYSTPPIGEKSNFLSVHAVVHTLPSKTVYSYSEALRVASIRPRRMLVAPYCLAEFVKHTKDMPKNYILVDMNNGYTSITLVNNNMPFNSSFFLSGYNDLVLSISSEFEIGEEDTKEILEKYGFYERNIGFETPLFNSEDELGRTKAYYQRDLNKAIQKFFVNYLNQFEATYNNVIEGCVAEVKKLPMILSGNMLKVTNIDKFVKEKFNEPEKIISISSDVIGCKGPENTSLIGALWIISQFKGSYSDEHSKISQLSREDK